jgi:hypothetical protein
MKPLFATRSRRWRRGLPRARRRTSSTLHGTSASTQRLDSSHGLATAMTPPQAAAKRNGLPEGMRVAGMELSDADESSGKIFSNRCLFRSVRGRRDFCAGEPGSIGSQQPKRHAGSKSRATAADLDRRLEQCAARGHRASSCSHGAGSPCFSAHIGIVMRSSEVRSFSPSTLR